MKDSMRVGLHALGIGPGADPEVIASVARAAEIHGFATLWVGEHVVMVDRPESRYPYSADGTIAVPAAADWLDPMIGLGFAAALTSRIRLATGILLLPEHNPVIIAKQAASLDRLSAGRFALGVGIGWSAEEFRALGIPFARRGARTAAYVDAIRTLWSTEVSSYHSEFVTFDSIRVNPKPARGRLPVLVGGNSERALQRVADWGDGWYGFNLASTDEVGDRMETLRQLCARRGRDWRSLEIVVALQDAEPADRQRLRDLGVAELVLVETPPTDPRAAPAWVEALATRWL
jgi:probable F420-dependent oxidoreductase